MKPRSVRARFAGSQAGAPVLASPLPLPDSPSSPVVIGGVPVVGSTPPPLLLPPPLEVTVAASVSLPGAAGSLQAVARATAVASGRAIRATRRRFITGREHSRASAGKIRYNARPWT